MIVLLKLITPPLIPLPVLPTIEGRTNGIASEDRRLPAPPGSCSPVNGDWGPSDLRPSEAGSKAQGLLSGVSWILWPMIVGSGLGTLVLLAAIERQVMRLRPALRHGVASDERLRRFVEHSARQMGLTTTPTICVVNMNISPLLWVRRSGPVIVIPSSLVKQLSDEHLACVIAHELAHYVRRDHWTNLLVLSIAAIFWWNPVVWWVRRELRVAQELCCDALVIGGRHATRRDSAAALFQVLEFTQTERALAPALASAFGGKTSIRRRFEMIADRLF